MTQYGQPSRTATSDANAGVVNPPATKEASRTNTSKDVRTTSHLDSALNKAGQSLGASFTKLLGNKAKNINAQRALDASIRQGGEKAINAIDEDKKRTGWTETVFGQDVEYRAAQQRAVGNTVQQTFLDQANRIEEFAAETPEQYSNRLREQLDAQLEQYPADAETQQIITHNWATASEELVKSHSKVHYGYNQLQQRETTKTAVRGTLDVFTTMSKSITTKAEADEFVQKGAAFFNMFAIPEGMTEVAYKSVLNEELAHSLEQGNIGAYNMAKANGWIDKLNDVEKTGIDKAIKAYETKSNYGMSVTVSDAKLALNDITGKDPEKQIETILQSAYDSLDGYEERTSGTDAYTSNVNNARLQLDRMLNNAIQSGAKASQKANDMEELVVAQEQSNEGYGTTLAGIESNYSKQDMVEATQIRFTRSIGAMVGDENITYDKAISAMMEDPQIGNKVVQNWGSDQFDAGFMQVIGQSYINGFAGKRMTDENGQPTPYAKRTVYLLSQFENKDRAKFKAQIGDDAYDEYTIVKDGQGAGKTEAMITKDIADWKAGNMLGDLKIDWKLPKDENNNTVSFRDHVRVKVTNMMGAGHYPSESDLARYVDAYKRGVTMGKGDLKRGDDYLFDLVKNKSANYNGKVIDNADFINDTLDNHTLPLLLKGMNNPKNNLAVGIIASAMGKTEDGKGDPIRSFNELPDVDFRPTPAGGLWVTSSKFQQPVLLSPDVVQAYSRKLTQNKNIDLEKKLIREESRIRAALGNTRLVNRGVTKEDLEKSEAALADHQATMKTNRAEYEKRNN